MDIDKINLPLKHKILSHSVKLVNKKDAESELIRHVTENYPAYNMDYEYACNLIKEKYMGKGVSWLQANLKSLRL